MEKEKIFIFYKGELSKSKFIEVYQQLFPSGDALKFCEHIFRTLDTGILQNINWLIKQIFSKK